MTAAMPLGTLLEGFADAGGLAGVAVRGLSLDSRALRPGEAFVALRGLHHHGIEFAAQARAGAASVILAEAPAPALPADDGPTIWIDHLGERLGALAARFFAEPGRALRITGVTGTNGKTSVVQLLAQALDTLGRPAATIGTLGSGRRSALHAGERTTPDAIRMQALLADFRDGGLAEVVMEVSSHALVQGRVNAVPFATAVFTNLSRDHLDYHGTMAAYFAAKARLFRWPGLQAAVINIDDEHGRALAQGLPAGVRGITCGIASEGADVRATDLAGHAEGFRFRLVSPWGEGEVSSRLLGRFNVANLLAVAACLGVAGIPFPRLVAVLSRLEPIRGRMQLSSAGGGSRPTVVVDYAHTPDALRVALESLRPHVRGQLGCVFGAGGDRDRGKRPEMGAVVERLADRFIITDDNPRSEDGAVIAAEIVAGLEHPESARVLRDRRAAIAQAIREAGPGDVVLIAGKGHETTQEDRSGRHPFDDLAVADAVLAELAATPATGGGA